MKQIWKMNGYKDKIKLFTLISFFLKAITTPKAEKKKIMTRKIAGVESRAKQGYMKFA